MESPTCSTTTAVSTPDATRGWSSWGRSANAEEIKRVHALIVRHHQYTASKLAERILADWDSYVAKFVSVMPTEYRAVLERQHLGTNNDMARLAAV